MAKIFWRYIQNWQYHSIFCKILHIHIFWTFFWNTVEIWPLYISINAQFCADSKNGFIFNLRLMVLTLEWKNCYILNNFKYSVYMSKIWRFFHSSVRTISRRLNVKPFLESVQNCALREVYKGHISTIFQKKVQKICICTIFQKI